MPVAMHETVVRMGLLMMYVLLMLHVMMMIMMTLLILNVLLVMIQRSAWIRYAPCARTRIPGGFRRQFSGSLHFRSQISSGF